MSYVKRIVCLANSYKPPDGRCIAGVEILEGGAFGGWIRPVSARPTAEVSYSEYKYQDGTSPKLLDIIDIPLLKASPHGHQTENHVLDPSGWWTKQGELPWEKLEEIRERPESIWTNSDHTASGVYDCMSTNEAATLQGSLVLIKKKDFTVEVGSSSWGGRTKRTYRGKFDYKGTHHSLSLTDPVARTAFSSRGEGDYVVNDVYLCLSVTEPFEKDGRCHKLVAAVIKDPPL